MKMMIFWNLYEIIVMGFIKIDEQWQFDSPIPMSYLKRKSERMNGRHTKTIYTIQFILIKIWNLNFHNFL